MKKQNKNPTKPQKIFPYRCTVFSISFLEILGVGEIYFSPSILHHNGMSSPSIPAPNQQIQYPVTSSGHTASHREAILFKPTGRHPNFSLHLDMWDTQDEGVEGEGWDTGLCPVGRDRGCCFLLGAYAKLFRDGVINTLQYQMGLPLSCSFPSPALKSHPQIRHLRKNQKGESVSAWLPSNMVGGYNKGIDVITDICATKKGGWQRVGVEGEGRSDRLKSLVADKSRLFQPSHPVQCPSPGRRASWKKPNGVKGRRWIFLYTFTMLSLNTNWLRELKLKGAVGKA